MKVYAVEDGRILTTPSVHNKYAISHLEPGWVVLTYPGSGPEIYQQYTPTEEDRAGLGLVGIGDTIYKYTGRRADTVAKALAIFTELKQTGGDKFLDHYL